MTIAAELWQQHVFDPGDVAVSQSSPHIETRTLSFLHVLDRLKPMARALGKKKKQVGRGASIDLTIAGLLLQGHPPKGPPNL